MKEECWVSDVKPQEPSGPSALDSNLEPMLFCTARVGKSQNFKCQSLLPRRKRLKMRAISEDHLEAWELLPDSRPPVPTCAPLMEVWATALKDLLILQHAFILQQRISGCNITKRRSQGPNTRLDFINAIHSPSGKPEMCSELWDCLQYCINGSGLSSDFFFNVGKLQAVSKHRGNPHCKFRSLGQREGRQSKYLPGQEDELCMGDQHMMAECTWCQVNAGTASLPCLAQPRLLHQHLPPEVSAKGMGNCGAPA